METVIRKTVPLMLSLLSASNPQLSILDTLSKYSHDNDLQVMLNAESSESPPLLQRPRINEKEDDTFQAVAIILIALVAMGEDVSVEMSLQQFNHLVHPSIQSSPIHVLTNSADALWRL